MNKIAISNDDLRQHLIEQIKFLKKSFEDYMKWDVSEAKRIAHTLRTLLHDKNSKSLLWQLNIKNIDFLDTATDLEPKNLEDWRIQIMIQKHGLVIIRMWWNWTYCPKCEAPREYWNFTDFNNRWNKFVIIDNNGNKFTRKDLVVDFLADKDGGSHVDPKIDEEYYKLTKNNAKAMGYSFTINWNESQIENIVLASVCQIGYEVLESFKKAGL